MAKYRVHESALVVILGPTASGKTSLSLDIAERFGGEIVNFDSVQVYRSFDIGTAKPAPSERRGIPHHLIDIAEPADLFTAGDYARLGRAALAEIRARGRLPVLTGGTGFYLRALLEGLFEGPQRDEVLRRRLQQRAETEPAGYLHRILTRLDPKSAQRIHGNDIPKLIRAIEVCLQAGKPISELWEEGRDRLRGYCVLRIGLDPPREQLYERIEGRAKAMFRAGLVDETRRLLETGVPATARPFGSLGYRQALGVLEGRLSFDDAVEETAKQTRRYAKRQMTWFRREPDVHWFRGFGNEPEVEAGAVKLVAAKLAQCRSQEF